MPRLTIDLSEDEIETIKDAIWPRITVDEPPARLTTKEVMRLWEKIVLARHEADREAGHANYD